MKQVTLNKTDLEIAAEDMDFDLFSARLRGIKIIYPEGVEQFSVADDVEVILTFEGND